MTKFIAIKINYDRRGLLPRYLKYSTIPTREQYQEYLNQFQDEGIGGNGFHECLNFKIPESAPVRLYLPPTCLPSSKNAAEDFVIFSFTYKGDKELSAHVVGVHAGVTILSTEAQGISRGKDQWIDGIEPLQYHAEAPPELVTLFSPPLKYENTQGLYTPPYSSWGNGLRYIYEAHAMAIVAASIDSATIALSSATIAEREIVQRQIEVLTRIDKKYSLGATDEKANKCNGNSPPPPSPPDRELGYLGEKHVYERELEYVKSIGGKPSEVQWVSQSVPTSPFDIRTVRQSSAGILEHFIEVKSSVAADANVYISSGQLEFFRERNGNATFALVAFDLSRSVKDVREISLPDLVAEFELVPIKFKLARRG